MTGAAALLRPATADEVAEALCQYLQGGTARADAVAAQIVAERLAQHLELSAFVFLVPNRAAQ